MPSLAMCNEYIRKWEGMHTYIINVCTYTHACNYQQNRPLTGTYHSRFSLQWTPVTPPRTDGIHQRAGFLTHLFRAAAHGLERYLLYSTSLQPQKPAWKLFGPTIHDKPPPFSSRPSFSTRWLKSEVKSTTDTFPPQGPWAGGAASQSIWSFLTLTR